MWFILPLAKVLKPLWQESHETVVGMWFDDLPIAVLPLWQVLQLPGVTPVWLNVAPAQLDVLWQESQEAVVVTCPDGLPDAVLPL